MLTLLITSSKMAWAQLDLDMNLKFGIDLGASERETVRCLRNSSVKLGLPSDARHNGCRLSPTCYNKRLPGGFPRNFKFVFGGRMTALKIELPETLIEAYYSREKLKPLRISNLPLIRSVQWVSVIMIEGVMY
jgi:hypothetical protein